MSLNELPGERPIDQRSVQQQVLAAVQHRVLKPLRKHCEGQERTREQQLELILRGVLRDQLIRDPLRLAGQSAEAGGQGIGCGVGGRHGREQAQPQPAGKPAINLLSRQRRPA